MDDAVLVTGAAGALGHAVVAELRARDLAVVALDRPWPRWTNSAPRTGCTRSRPNWTTWPRSAPPSPRSTRWPGRRHVALAGGSVPGKLADLDEDSLESLWRSNVVSLLWCCQEAAPRMAAAGGGAIVSVGSRTAVGGPAPLAHALSKSAVVRATELLADELRPQAIRVNCVLPSVIDTPANRAWMSPELAARAVAPAAIAKVIAFLIGPDAAPISAARIPVYGDS